MYRHQKSFRAAVEAGVLKLDQEALAKGADIYAKAAGIDPKYLFKKAGDFCDDAEVQWARNINKDSAGGCFGVVYTGAFQPSVEERFSALAAAFIRVQVSARVVPVTKIYQHMKQGTLPESRVLFVPDFFYETSTKIPSWQVQEMCGFISHQLVNGRQTVLYVSSMKSLKEAAGPQVVRQLVGSFKSYEAGVKK